jgi:hypothetical protein
VKYDGMFVPLVRLKLRNPEFYSDSRGVLTAKYYSFPPKWLSGRSVDYIKRERNPVKLHRLFLELRESYIAHVSKRKNRLLVSPALKPEIEFPEEQDILTISLDDMVHPYAEEFKEAPPPEESDFVLHRNEFQELFSARKENVNTA